MEGRGGDEETREEKALIRKKRKRAKEQGRQRKVQNGSQRKEKEIKIIKEDKGRRMNRRNIVEKIRWVEEKNKIVICLDVKYKRLC